MTLSVQIVNHQSISRPLRISYPNTWYHVMNRGRRAENIFLDKLDYVAFVELLQETSEARNIQKKFILDLLTDNRKLQLRLYRRFVAVHDDKEVEDVLARIKWPSFLGPKEFVAWVKATYKVC